VRGRSPVRAARDFSGSRACGEGARVDRTPHYLTSVSGDLAGLEIFPVERSIFNRTFLEAS
jgi:hypothetical protein